MVFFSFSLASAGFFWFFIQWIIIKKDLPTFLKRALFNIRHLDEVRDQGKPHSFTPYQFGYVIWSGIACGFVVYLLTPDGGGPGFGFLFGSALWFFSIIRYGRVEKSIFYRMSDWHHEQVRAGISTALGAKGWATVKDVSSKVPRVVASDGTSIGIHIGEGLHWYDKGHMLTVGGSGQGKGATLALPAILSDGFVAGGISGVFLDVKGEAAAVAAPFLKRSGYDVHVINPFGIKEVAHLGNSRFNPFDLIDPDDDEASRLYDVLAMALHNRRGEGDNSFFDNRCRQYISLFC